MQGLRSLCLVALIQWRPMNPSPLKVLRGIGRTVVNNIGTLRYYVGDANQRRDDAGLSGETVLLIQGFFQTRRVMETLEQRLRADGYRVVSFHLGGLFNNFNTRGIPGLARLIDQKVRRLMDRRGIDSLHVIGHSKGGMVARCLVQQAGGQEYARTVITLGTPHHGTPTAAIGAGVGLLLVSRSLWQLLPGSSLVKSLNSEPFPSATRLVSVYSRQDLVCPYACSILTPRDGEDVRNIQVQGLGHMELVEDPYVYGLLLRELKGRPMDAAAGPVADWDDRHAALRRQ